MPGPQDSLCVDIKCVGFICQGEWGRGGMPLAGIGSHTIDSVKIVEYLRRLVVEVPVSHLFACNFIV